MKILIVGRGWTGRKMYNEIQSRKGHSARLVSHNPLEILNELKTGEYHWVVNCAGVTGTPNVDACEKDKANTLLANALFPTKLLEMANGFGARLAHFSSGCIYQGTIDDVNADPNYFGSIYSVSKGVSDVLLKNRALVFRIRMPFTGILEPKNYLTKVINYAKNGKLIDGGQNSLTDLDEAVEVACNLILHNVPDGPYNLVNEGSVNMHELADLLGLENVNWFTPEEFKAATAADRSNCVIRDSGLMINVRDALETAIQSIKNAK
jgi:dTDP-4-dehydrorhamnose reductase